MTVEQDPKTVDLPLKEVKEPKDLEDELSAFATESSLPFSEEGLFKRSAVEVHKKAKNAYKLMEVFKSSEIPVGVTDLLLDARNKCFLKLPPIACTKGPIHFTFRQGTSYRMFVNKDEHIDGYSGARIHPGDVGTLLPSKEHNVVC